MLFTEPWDRFRQVQYQNEARGLVGRSRLRVDLVSTSVVLEAGHLSEAVADVDDGVGVGKDLVAGEHVLVDDHL